MSYIDAILQCFLLLFLLAFNRISSGFFIVCLLLQGEILIKSDLKFMISVDILLKKMSIYDFVSTSFFVGHTCPC